MIRLLLKWIAALLYVLFIVFLVGLVVFRTHGFEGVLIVAQGRSEHWVARPHEKDSLFSFAYRSLPAELIGFDNPRAVLNLLGKEESFDAEPLPFSLHLEKTEVLEKRTDTYILEVTYPGKQLRLEADIGLTVEIPEGVLKVQAQEPWAGLVRGSEGRPMAAIAFQDTEGNWHPQVFASADESLHPLPGVMALLRRFPDESAARSAFPEKNEFDREMRWGIREGGRIHWFNSLAPGTGLTRSDGVEFTLVDSIASRRGETTHLVVEKKTGAGSSREKIPANRPSEGQDILFERHDNDIVFLMHAWSDGRAWVAPYVSGKKQPETPLREGGSLDVRLDGQRKLCLRMDHVLLNAVPVPEFKDGVKALVLETPKGVLRLREGMSRPVQETRVAYRRQPQPPPVRYTLRAVFGGEEPPLEFTLQPQDKIRIGDWQFFHDRENVHAATIAVLSARHTPGTAALYGALILLGLSSAGMLFARFVMRKKAFRATQEPENLEGWERVSKMTPDILGRGDDTESG